MEDVNIGEKLRLIWVLSFPPMCLQSSFLVFSWRLSLRPQSPPLSNQGTPLIPSCPIGREQYAEIFSCVHGCCFFDALLFLWMFVFMQSGRSFVFLQLVEVEQKDIQIFLTFLDCLSSVCSCSPQVTSVWKKNKSRKPQVTFDLRQSRSSCSSWAGRDAGGVNCVVVVVNRNA